MVAVVGNVEQASTIASEILLVDRAVSPRSITPNLLDAIILREGTLRNTANAYVRICFSSGGSSSKLKISQIIPIPPLDTIYLPTSHTQSEISG